MAFGITNIEKVRATAFLAGSDRVGKPAVLPGLTLVSWRSSETDKLFQVYVNGQLAGVTWYREQRMLLVEYDDTHTAAIEVIWVTSDCKCVDYSEQLTGFGATDGSHAVLGVLRCGTLPLGSTAALYWDSGTGEIDYSEPLAERAVWSDPLAKWGWGLDAFGKGDFGYSGTAAAGWGRGSFGEGEFGFDAELLTFKSGSLAGGDYQFALRLSDAVGNLDAGEVEIVSVNIRIRR